MRLILKMLDKLEMLTLSRIKEQGTVWQCRNISIQDILRTS